MIRGSVVFLNRFYWPDVAATAQMLADLAEGLVALGWDVTVITSATDYTAASAVRSAAVRNGVRVVRVRGTRLGRAHIIFRSLDQGTYLVAAALRLLRMPRVDLVVAMTDPPLALPIAVVTSRARGHKVVCWLQDLFPELAGRLGVLDEGGMVYRAWASLARRLYARCDMVVALGPSMARHAIAAGSPPGRTVVLSNWADSDSVRPVAREASVLARSEALAEKFVVLYSGNAGRAHTFEAVIGAAKALRNEPDVVFVFVGAGAKMADVRRAAESESLTNVSFLPYVPREQLGDLLATASVGLVTEDPRAAGLVLPSKIYGILASGRPVLFVGSEDSDVAEIVREADCGFVVGPADPQQCVAVIRRLRASPEYAGQLGRHARQAAESRFDKKDATRRWDQLLIDTLTDS